MNNLDAWEEDAKMSLSALLEDPYTEWAGNKIDQDRILDLIRVMRKKDLALSVAREALQWSREMFIARDQMNANVHCAPLRTSPITDRVIQACKNVEEAFALEEK